MAPSRLAMPVSSWWCCSWPWSLSDELLNRGDALLLQGLDDKTSVGTSIRCTECAHVGVKADLEPTSESCDSWREYGGCWCPSSSSHNIIPLLQLHLLNHTTEVITNTDRRFLLRIDMTTQYVRWNPSVTQTCRAGTLKNTVNVIHTATQRFQHCLDHIWHHHSFPLILPYLLINNSKKEKWPIPQYCTQNRQVLLMRRCKASSQRLSSNLWLWQHYISTNRTNCKLEAQQDQRDFTWKFSNDTPQGLRLLITNDAVKLC